MARPVYQVHIADGFADDCDELIHRCSKMDTLTYKTFCEIYKDLNMACIYNGRSLGAEIAELSEEVIHIAKRYMVANTSNFEEQVAGLFLVYALLHLQPYSGFATLRLVPDDIPAISRIELVARRERRLDVLFILGSVLIRGPCEYHAELRERGLESAYRKYLEGCTSIDKVGVRPKGVFYRQNEELDMFRELGNLSRLYTDAKANVKDKSGRMDRNLNFMDKNLIKDLDTSLKKIINGIIENEDDKYKLDDYDDVHHNRVQAIKRAAYKNVVDSVNHLTGVKEKRNKSPKKKSSDVISICSSSVKDKPESINITKSDKGKSPKTPVLGKVKSASPRKPVTTASPNNRIKRKRKPRSKTILSSNKKIRQTPDSEPDSDTEITFKQSEEIADDLNTEEFHKVVEIETDNNAIDTEPVEVATIVPVVLRTDRAQTVEIEFIDHFDKNRTPVRHEITESLSSVDPGNSEEKEEPTTDVSKRKLRSYQRRQTKKKDEEMAVVSKISNKEVFKKPEDFKLTKPDKCLLKNTHLRSKFKKLGLLPVTSFKDSEDKLKTTD